MPVDEILADRGFIRFCEDGSELDETDDGYDIEHYREWTIGLMIPNGGYVGIDMKPPEDSPLYSRNVEADEDHDYHDRDRLIDIAKEAIDAAERDRAVAPGQMSLFGGEVRS